MQDFGLNMFAAGVAGVGSVNDGIYAVVAFVGTAAFFVRGECLVG